MEFGGIDNQVVQVGRKRARSGPPQHVEVRAVEGRRHADPLQPESLRTVRHAVGMEAAVVVAKFSGPVCAFNRRADDEITLPQSRSCLYIARRVYYDPMHRSSFLTRSREPDDYSDDQENTARRP